MGSLSNIKPSEVFKYFEEICKIPHGSGNMGMIARYCVSFAKENNLEYVKDDANNVIIYKKAAKGYEDKPAVILQGHLDMVCQKTAESVIDFEKDSIEIYVDGDFIKARGTTLGADNGIAVSMMLAILASDSLSHPAIEAVFTTDEEVGMIGAGKLDVSLLNGKRLINLDSEEEDVLTVSCAGGSDFKANLPISRNTLKGKRVKVTIQGLLGGHSGIEIDKGRVNANKLMGRLLGIIGDSADFEIIKINGGDKGNAIPLFSEAELCVIDTLSFLEAFDNYAKVLKAELKSREEGLEITAELSEDAEFEVMDKKSRDSLLYVLLQAPDGIVEMSKEIPGLVETSLNLGILKTEDDRIYIQYALRSNKSSALDFLQIKMEKLYKAFDFVTEISGKYQPWEYKESSELRKLYIDTFFEKTKTKPRVEAIHAGLECAVFSASIPDIDCIAIGPDMFDVHTTQERLSIKSTAKIFEIVCDMLEKM